MKSVISAKRLERLSNGKAHVQRQTAIGKLVSKARAAGHTGPLIIGPVPSGGKSSWRDDARALGQICPGEFGPSAEGKAYEAETTSVEGGSAKVDFGEGTGSGVQGHRCQDVEREARPQVGVHSEPEPAVPEPVKLPPAEWFERFIGFGADSRRVALADAIECVRLIVIELKGTEGAQQAEVRLGRGRL